MVNCPVVQLFILFWIEVDGEYQMTQFRGDERMVSPTFPDLNLTANQIFSVEGT